MTKLGVLRGAIKSRLAWEGLLVICGQSVGALVGLAAIRAVTEVVPAEVYGEINLVLATLGIAQGLLLAPLLSAELRFYPEARENGYLPALGRALLSMFARGLIVALAAAVILNLMWALGSGRLLPVGIIAVGLFWLVATAAVGHFKNTLNADRLHGVFAVVNVAESVARPGAAIMAVVLLGASTIPFIFGQAIGLSAVVLLIAVWGLSRHRFQGEGSRDLQRSGALGPPSLQRDLWEYVFPLVPLAGVNWAVHLGDRYLLAYFHGTTELGVYVAAYSLMSQPFLLLGSSATLLFRPYLFDSATRSEGSYMVRHRHRWLGLTLAAGGVVWILVTVLREPIGRVLLADDYRSGTAIFPLIAGAYLVLAVGFAYENWLLAAKETKAVLVSSVVALAVSLVFALFLIPRFSSVGAAWATLLGLTSYTVMCFVMSHSRANRSGVPLKMRQ